MGLADDEDAAGEDGGGDDGGLLLGAVVFGDAGFDVVLTTMFGAAVDVLVDGVADMLTVADIESVGSVTAPPESLADGPGSELTDTAVGAAFGGLPLEMM